MKGVLLVNLGSPDTPEPKDVKKYLGEFLMDERVIDVPLWARNLLVKGIILNTRPKASAKAYQKIWWDEGSPLIVISAANFAASILIESGLSFLGLGAQPPMTSWGLMIKDHYNYIILGEPFLAIIPGLCIMLLVSSFMILGNSLRDILDVRD